MDQTRASREIPILFFLGLLLINWILGTSLYYDGDTHWHLAAGYEILQQKAIPHHDPWTFSSDQQWFNISWLFDIAIALIHIPFGDTGLLLLTLAFNAFLATEIFRTLPAWGNISLEARTLATLLSATALTNYAILRPQLAACLLVLYTLVALQKSRTNPKALLALPILTLIWANTHGSFPLLALLLGTHGVEALLQKNSPRLKLLLAVTFACLLTTLINPLGYNIYHAISRTLDSGISPYITEWKGWSAHTTTSHGTTTLIFMVGLLGASTLLPTRNTPWASRIVIFSLTILSLLSIRTFSFLAIAAPPMIAFSLNTLPKPTIKTSSWAALLLLNLLLATIILQPRLQSQFSTHKNPHTYDVETITILTRLLPEKSKILNEYSLGGALANLQKTHQYYIDGRAGTAFSEEILEEYIKTFLKGTIPLQRLQEKYQPDALILTNASLESTFITPQLNQIGWRLVHTNKKNRIYLPPQK
jgi:hypothetical protein